MQCKSITSETPFFLITDTASEISFIEDAPVEIIIGFPVSHTLSIKGISTISGEAILYAFESSSSKKSTALKSKGLEKIEMPSEEACEIEGRKWEDSPTHGTKSKKRRFHCVVGK